MDENHCADLCTAGCAVDAVPAACKARWGPAGSQYLQDPNAGFRILTARAKRVSAGAAPVKVSVYVDGLHSSAQPPCFITGGALENVFSASDPGNVPPNITGLMLGVKAFPDGSSPFFMTGDVAELLVYNKALSVPEMDRVANYLSRKFALDALRLDAGFASPTRSVPLSCANCAGPGPVGEGGTTYDSHLVYAAATYNGSVPNVTALLPKVFAVNLSASATAAGLLGLLVTVCVGPCSASPAAVRGTALVTAATGSGFAYNVTVTGVGVAGVTGGDGVFFSANDRCADDWGAV